MQGTAQLRSRVVFGHLATASTRRTRSHDIEQALSLHAGWLHWLVMMFNSGLGAVLVWLQLQLQRIFAITRGKVAFPCIRHASLVHLFPFSPFPNALWRYWRVAAMQRWALTTGFEFPGNCQSPTSGQTHSRPSNAPHGRLRRHGRGRGAASQSLSRSFGSMSGRQPRQKNHPVGGFAASVLSRKNWIFAPIGRMLDDACTVNGFCCIARLPCR